MVAATKPFISHVQEDLHERECITACQEKSHPSLLKVASLTYLPFQPEYTTTLRLKVKPNATDWPKRTAIAMANLTSSGTLPPVGQGK